MRWTWLQPRFGLRTLLAVVLVSALAIAWWTSAGRWRSYNNLRARQRIDPYELKIAGEGDPYNVPPELVAILGDSRLRHWSWVRDVEILPGDLLASLGQEHVLRIWDLKTLQQKASYDCSQLLVQPDRKRSFLVRGNGEVEVWDLPANRKLSTILTLKPLGSVTLACNADGSRLAIQNGLINQSRQLIVADVAQKAVVWQRDLVDYGSEALALDQEGKRLAWTTDRTSTIVIADIASDTLRKPLGPITDGQSSYGINQIEFTADGERLIVCSALSKLLSFDIESGEAETVVEHDGGSLHRFWISESGKQLTVLQGWLFTHSLSYGEWSKGNPRPLGNVHVHDASHKGLMIAAAHHNNTISLWHRRRASQPWRLPSGGLQPDVSALDFDPHGSWLVTGSRTGELTFWDAADWSRMRSWKAHAAEIKHIEVSRDGSQVVTSSEDGDVVVWDVEAATEISTLQDFQLGWPVSLSADNRRLATQARGPIYSGFWDLPQGIELPVSSLPSGKLSEVKYSPAGELLVGRDGAQDFVFADSDTLKIVVSVAATTTPLAPLRWFPNGKSVLVLEGKDAVAIYDIAGKKTGASLKLGTTNARSFAIHPSGETIAFSGYGIPVQLWHLPTRTLLKSWQCGPTNGVVSQIAFSPDGHYLATVNGNGTAYVLNLDGVLP